MSLKITNSTKFKFYMDFLAITFCTTFRRILSLEVVAVQFLKQLRASTSNLHG